ncbi:MAG: aminotransferase class I/II-fold pyridoxal phosphate-dependent enzyme [Pseudomonadota bacterium]
MNFPERFSDLPEYAFPRLRRLLDGIPPGGPEVAMSIGEPKHPFPDWVGDVISEHLAGFGNYPPNDGAPELHAAITGWIGRRYNVEVAADRILALNGTREGLFNSVIALCPESKAGAKPVVLVPNPFYQVYAVAALAVGAEPVYVPATAATGFLPDFSALPKTILDRTAFAFICSPANPQGSVAGSDYLTDLLDLAERHDFRIAADECYSEVYRDAPPPGILEVAAQRGTDPERVLAFHSLSKRSSLPGLRAGFVAAGPAAMARMRQLRAYAGAPPPLPLQRVAERLWSDETHVIESRAMYSAKYDIADRVLSGIQGCGAPEAGFFLWLPVEDGEVATVKVWRETGVKILPGAYLARDADGVNPGHSYVRAAMVNDDLDGFEAALIALRDCLYG